MRACLLSLPSVRRRSAGRLGRAPRDAVSRDAEHEVALRTIVTGSECLWVHLAQRIDRATKRLHLVRRSVGIEHLCRTAHHHARPVGHIPHIPHIPIPAQRPGRGQLQRARPHLIGARLDIPGTVHGSGSVELTEAGFKAAFDLTIVPLSIRAAAVLAIETKDGVTGVLIGVITAVTFALLPLLRVRGVSPLGALRRRVEPLRTTRRDPLRWAVHGGLVLGVLLLVIGQVGSVPAGAAITAGIATALLLLAGLAWLIIRVVRVVPRAGLPYPVRQGLANLYRPGNQTATVTVALGFGVFLLGTLLLVQHNLLLPLRPDVSETRANLLFWDVQEDQVAGLDDLLESQSVPVTQRAPIIPMRIAAVNGEEVRPWREEAEGDDGDDAIEREDRPERWAVRREYRSTYRAEVSATEVLREGG